MASEWGHLYTCNNHRKFCNSFAILFTESKRLGAAATMKDKHILSMEIRLNQFTSDYRHNVDTNTTLTQRKRK